MRIASVASAFPFRAEADGSADDIGIGKPLDGGTDDAKGEGDLASSKPLSSERSCSLSTRLCASTAAAFF